MCDVIALIVGVALISVVVGFLFRYPPVLIPSIVTVVCVVPVYVTFCQAAS